MQSIRSPYPKSKLLEAAVKFLAVLAIFWSTACSPMSGSGSSSQVGWPGRTHGKVYLFSNEIPGEVQKRAGRVIAVEAREGGQSVLRCELGSLRSYGFEPTTKAKNAQAQNISVTLKSPPAYARKLIAAGENKVTLYYNSRGHAQALVWDAPLIIASLTDDNMRIPYYAASQVSLKGKALNPANHLHLWAEDSHEGVHTLIISYFPKITIPPSLSKEYRGKSTLEPAWVYGSYRKASKVESQLADGGLDLIRVERDESQFF